jgi:N-acetylglucosaminyldiphosphoundecaprenol N-acetyl-beta-D-mannosaminyltransferase
MERKKAKLLGFDVDTFGQEGALQSAVAYATNLIATKTGGQIITINPEMIQFGLKNPPYAEILKNADLSIPDGVGVKIGLKIKGINAQRIAGIEFSHKLVGECAKNNFSIALIGAKPTVLEKAAQNLKTEFKHLNIVYMQDGYFKSTEDVYWGLGEKNPQLVLVALGSPKQETFIHEYRKHHPETVMIGVGGSFDVWSGEVERAPEIYQKLGLEWLYRTVKQPERLKRIFPNLPVFFFRVLLDKKNK